jgi:hypothetical protein
MISLHGCTFNHHPNPFTNTLYNVELPHKASNSPDHIFCNRNHVEVYNEEKR